MAKAILNESILISILSLQEAQSSCEIENIITTTEITHLNPLIKKLNAAMASGDTKQGLSQRKAISKIARNMVDTGDQLLEKFEKKGIPRADMQNLADKIETFRTYISPHT